MGLILTPSGRDGRLRRRGRTAGALFAFVCLSILAHVVFAGLFLRWAPDWLLGKVVQGDAVTTVLLIQEPPEEAEEAPLEPEPEWDGQIVEIAPPEIEERPDQSDYLSRYDSKVEKETRTQRFDVNPEVLAAQWSKEKQAEVEEAEDLQVEKQSTGATVGNHRFDPHRDGNLASLPSPWERTNRVGDQDPVKGGARAATLAGAPQNDLLDEEIGDRVGLNTTNYPYAGYMERIRRAVNYWWEQNLDNLPSSVRLTRHDYTTVVEVILDGDGALEHIRVTDGSGVAEIDDCVVRAFKLAAPFENPPPGLVRPDGRVYLPEFDFTMRLAAARMQYDGVDPRAGVQFPGILKSPR